MCYLQVRANFIWLPIRLFLQPVEGIKTHRLANSTKCTRCHWQIFHFGKEKWKHQVDLIQWDTPASVPKTLIWISGCIILPLTPIKSASDQVEPFFFFFTARVVWWSEELQIPPAVAFVAEQWRVEPPSGRALLMSYGWYWVSCVLL